MASSFLCSLPPIGKLIDHFSGVVLINGRTDLRVIRTTSEIKEAWLSYLTV
jgi:hypothetical protein